ncbi:MAG: hypothetical protein GX159_04950 [Flavobacteriaceae bacterium]|jgi:hypothetical protein|nr:hypothetical protein [Flavobacteriaceae bacterium]
MQKYILIYSLICFSLISCEIKTHNAKKSYGYWEDGNIQKEVEILEGNYWKSPHWTYEYVVYLKLKPSKEWMNKFSPYCCFEEGKLIEDSVDFDIYDVNSPDWLPKPVWFHPDKNFVVFGNEFSNRYFWNEKDSLLYIYEIQL